MTNYMIVESDTNKVLLTSDYDLELETQVEELEMEDVEYTIYEEVKPGCWEEAEFYCSHTQYHINSHGGWEERCDVISSHPSGCIAHRDVF